MNDQKLCSVVAYVFVQTSVSSSLKWGQRGGFNNLRAVKTLRKLHGTVSMEGAADV